MFPLNKHELSLLLSLTSFPHTEEMRETEEDITRVSQVG